MATSIIEAFKLIGQSLLNFIKLDFAQADAQAQAGGAILRNSFRNAGEAGANAYAEGKQVGQALIDQKNAVLISAEQKAAADMEAVNAAAAQREYEIRTGSANDIQAIVDGKVINITDAESLLRDQVSDIYEDMGDFQVSDYESTTSELLDAAAARRQSLTETESGGTSSGSASFSGGSSSSGGRSAGGSAFGVLLDDSEAGRAARRNIPVGAYNPFTGRKDLREYVQNFMAESGIAFRQGFSGENFMARFSGKEIVIPENFSKGIKKGRFRLVGVNDRPNDLKGGSQSVKVSVGFNGPEAAKVLTANQRTESTLNLDRARRFLS